MEISQEDFDKYQQLESKLQAANAEAAAHRKSKSEIKSQLDESLSQIKQLQDAIEKPNADFKIKETELTQAAQKAREHADAWQKRFEQKAIDEALITAASKGNAHDANVVAKLVRDNIALDKDGKVFVKSGEGVMTNERGERVSVDDYVARWLGENPYLVKAGAAGSGSSGGAKQPSGAKTISRTAFNNLTPIEKTATIKSGVSVIE